VCVCACQSVCLARPRACVVIGGWQGGCEEGGGRADGALATARRMHRDSRCARVGVLATVDKHARRWVAC
jgi:hypothetical protein